MTNFRMRERVAKLGANFAKSKTSFVTPAPSTSASLNNFGMAERVTRLEKSNPAASAPAPSTSASLNNVGMTERVTRLEYVIPEDSTLVPTGTDAGPASLNNVGMAERVTRLYNSTPSNLTPAYKVYTPPVEPALPALLYAWYDAADSSTIITDGSNNVTAWNDKGIYGNHLNITPTTKPTYNTRTFNGLNVVNFPVGTEYMRRDGMTIPKSNLSWYIVCQVDAVSNLLDAIISFVGQGSDNSWQLISNNATEFRGVLLRGNVTGRDTSYYGQENKIGDYHMFQFAFDDERQEDSIFLNGNFKETVTSRAPIFQNGGTFYLFTNRSRTWQPSGAVAEVLCVNSVLTETRQKMEAHLAWKWGIESKLPADHPYKTTGSPFTNFPNN